MEVGGEPVAGPDGVPRGVTGVGDLICALAVVVNEVSLPPRDHGTALVRLGTEVERRICDGHKPNEPAKAVQNHEPGLARSRGQIVAHRQEDVGR